MGFDSSADTELQEFLAVEQQKAMFQLHIHRLTNHCWDACVDQPKEKFSQRNETCLSNCVERFLDVSLLISTRFQQMLQKSLNN
ncbi:hypothetical protein HELRODRAFT_83205 [Helobdella robusta]|uniref:Mitochondrial import inner membrane translocase subunit n=1 Tax=Helobdella robusta TaxID=6412 RepID=T1G520_HELRO|nr:hypothetical protein HELRODRAFT_83205 [Helobdella robusta]ESO00225.1 hypothetical protein HELRODRAFT_83205 [Helobdella robusta]